MKQNQKVSKIAIGIDNGVTGAIGIIADKPYLFKMPVKNELSYTKTKQNINRIHYRNLYSILDNFKYLNIQNNSFALLERPMVNPGRFKATLSAMRALEATLIALEELGIPYSYIDSKEWQKELLPKGLEKEELKKASLDIGIRLFPSIDFKGFKDADALMIARYIQIKGY